MGRIARGSRTHPKGVSSRLYQRATHGVEEGVRNTMMRSWGVVAPLFSLRSEADGGIGDIGSLVAFGKVLRERGRKLDRPLAPRPHARRRPIPYSAHSSFAIDPIYMDLRDIVGDSFCDTREETAANVHVDYAKVRAQKRAAIALAYQRFLGHPRHRAILDTFVEEQKYWLEPFARFEVFCGRYGLDWQSWPKETTPSRLEARPDAQRWSTPIDPSIDRIYFEQWILHTQ